MSDPEQFAKLQATVEAQGIVLQFLLGTANPQTRQLIALAAENVSDLLMSTELTDPQIAMIESLLSSYGAPKPAA